MAVANGIYRIVPKLALYKSVEVAGGSTAVHANVQIYDMNDGNCQLVWVGTDSSGSTDFRFVHSGQMLDVWGAEAKTGSNITQYPYNRDSRAQEWELVYAGEYVLFNGVRHDLYYIKSKINQNYALDAWSGQTKNGTNVWLYEFNKTDAQKWALLKDSYYDQKMPVPANVGGVLSGNGARQTRFAVNAGTTKFYPAWKCSPVPGYQVTWCWRGRKKGTSTWTAWSVWRNPSGSTADRGEGDAWQQNVWSWNHSAAGYYSPLDSIPVQVDNKLYDRNDFAIDVRAFGTTSALDWNADGLPKHGASAEGSVSFVWNPTITVDTVTFTPDGLLIGYSSDLVQGGNRISIGRIKGSSGYLTNREVSFSGRPYTGTLLVPFSEMTRIPKEGEAVSFSATITTVDSATRTQGISKACAYDTRHGVAISVTQTLQAGDTVLVKIGGSYSSSECHLTYEQDGETVISECPAASGGFVATPPFGKPYSLFVRASKTDNSWGTLHVAGRIVAGSGHMFNYAGGWCRIALFDDYDSSVSRSVERDYEAYQTNGRPYESVFFGKGSKGSMAVDAVAPLDKATDPDTASLADIEALAVKRYATYRTPIGDRREVAIVSYSVQALGAAFAKVSLELKERS